MKELWTDKELGSEVRRLKSLTVTTKTRDKLYNKFHPQDDFMPIYTMWRSVKNFYKTIYLVNRSQVLETFTRCVELHRQHQRDDFRQEHKQVPRLVYNYLASLFTLVDLSRRLVAKHYRDTNFEKEYQGRVNATSKTVQHCLLKDLRNMYLHRRFPNVGLMSSPVRGKPRTLTSLTITKADLLSWPKLSSSSKQYLKSLPTSRVDFTTVLKRHSRLLDDFYDWFFKQLKSLHKQEIKDTLTMSALSKMYKDNNIKRGRPVLMVAPKESNGCTCAVDKRSVKNNSNQTVSDIRVTQIKLPSGRVLKFPNDSPKTTGIVQ